MTRRRQAPHYRSLRLERSEDRRLLSAASVAAPEVTADDTLTYLPINTSGWVAIDSDSQLPSFDFGSFDATVSDSTTRDFKLSDAGISNGVLFDRLDVEGNFSLTLGTLNATAQSYRDEADSLRLTLDGSAVQSGLTLNWNGAQSGLSITPLLRSEVADRVVVVDAGFVETVLSGLQDDGVALRGNGSPMTEVVQRWLSENQAFFENLRPDPEGWIGDGNDTYLGDGGDSTPADLESWADIGSETGPATPTLDNTFTRDEHANGNAYDDGPAYSFSESDDIGTGPRLLSKLREWLRDETVRAASDSLEESESRSRRAPAPLERVAETPAPKAGEESPGAGMIDLAALLLPASGSDEAPSVALAAASLPADEGAASAHDAALAVESWVRTLPVPAEAIGVVEGMAPPIESPAVGVRKDLPVKQVVPQPQPAKDRVSAAGLDLSVEGHQTPARGSQAPAERLDEQQATSGSGFVAAWLTTLLGGAVVWANRRGGRNRMSDCIETPRRETGRNA
jgi:hypothetical protein